VSIGSQSATDPGWEADDLHLRRLEASPVRLAAPQVAEIDLGTPAVHVLRGPRQAGKSTDLKLLARRALEAGVEPRQVVYLSLDLLEDQPPAALATAPGRALPGRSSLVAGRDELEFGRSASIVPAALLLWALSG
jgi:hypothetical protein